MLNCAKQTTNLWEHYSVSFTCYIFIISARRGVTDLTENYSRGYPKYLGTLLGTRVLAS